MMRGVWVAYAVVSWCYFGVSCAGYWAFGNNVMSNVIFSIGHPKWMVAMADLFVTVHVIGSYEVGSRHFVQSQMLCHTAPKSSLSMRCQHCTHTFLGCDNVLHMHLSHEAITQVLCHDLACPQVLHQRTLLLLNLLCKKLVLTVDALRAVHTCL